MTNDRTTDKNVGWGRSDKQTITIVVGATGSALAPVNLERNYAYILIRCADCTNIQASTTLAVNVAMEPNQAVAKVYTLDSGTLTELAPTLPTTGSMQFLCVPALGAQFVQLVMNKAASGGSVVFEVYGLAESVA